MNSIVVKKLGGENSAKINVNINNILGDFHKGLIQAIVVSAKRSPNFNSTDKLIKVGKQLKAGNKQEAIEIFNEIEKFNIDYTQKEVEKGSMGKEEKNELINHIHTIFEGKKGIIDGYDDTFYPPEKSNDYLIKNEQKNFSILGFGEILEAESLAKVLNLTNSTKSQIAEFVNLEDIINPNSLFNMGENEYFIYWSQMISKAVKKVLEKNRIPIVPGYSGRFPRGIESTIGRGYTDAAAAALSVGMKSIYDSVELQIQKSVPGLLSSDPRIVGKKAKLIEYIDYTTAKEITGSRGAQAKLLHEQALRKEVLDAGIEVKIIDPENTTSGYKGTLISEKKSTNTGGIEFIGVKGEEVVISLSLDNMSDPGLLNIIGEIFAKNSISVNQMSTSETSLTLTCCKNKNKNINKAIRMVKKALKIEENNKRNFIKKEEENALIYIIGQNMKGQKGLIKTASSIIEENDININMITQGAEERAIIISIDENHKEKAIKALHSYFIEQKVK